MRKTAAALLLVLSSALYGEDGADAAQQVESAMARGDRAAALAALDAMLLPDAPRDRRRSVAAARAAVDLVKGPEGNLRAARILVDTLKGDRGDRESAYTMAKGLWRRVLDIDLPAAHVLLEGLVQIYPETLEFAYDLATTYRHEGLVDDAGAVYARIAKVAPSERTARLWLVWLFEERGDVESAVAVYDEMIALHERDPSPDLKAHLAKARLLLRLAHDYDGARKALDAGDAAAAAAAPGTERDGYADELKAARSELESSLKVRTALRDMRANLHGAIVAASAAWALILGGGVVWLRRKDWI